MALTVTDKQLEVIDNERQSVVVVQHRRTKKGYVVMPESVYNQVRPLIEFMSEKGAIAGHGETSWTDAKNARRMALINQKYDSKLTASEKRELASLQDEVGQFQEQIASQRNIALELIVQVLEQRAKKPPA